MVQIRSFQNCDLPALADVWIRHWSAVGPSPPVSIATIEQAVLSRAFFDAETLMVATLDDSVVAWCHYQSDPCDDSAAVICSICFTSEEGLAVCDQLLREVESRIAQSGFSRVTVGMVRDNLFGYAGLAPIGHGIGISATDARTSSLLSRSGYGTDAAIYRLVVSTSPYRAPVSRELLQLRRTTRVEQALVIPDTSVKASAMSHLDAERQTLIDHRSRETLASIDVWLSDPEAQVMSCADAILDLGEIHDRGKLLPTESFLIATAIQSLANRRVFTVETAVDQNQTELIAQLKTLNFNVAEQGHRWGKSL